MTPLLGDRLYVSNGHLIYKDDQNNTHNVYLYNTEGGYDDIMTQDQFLSLMEICKITQSDLQLLNNGRFVLTPLSQSSTDPNYEAYFQEYTGASADRIYVYKTLPDDYDPSTFQSLVESVIADANAEIAKFQELAYRSPRNFGLYARLEEIPGRTGFQVKSESTFTEFQVKSGNDWVNTEVYVRPYLDPDGIEQVWDSEDGGITPNLWIYPADWEDHSDPWITCCLSMLPNATHIDLTGLAYTDPKYHNLNISLPKETLVEITFDDHSVLITDLTDGIDTDYGVSIKDYIIDSGKKITRLYFYYEIPNTL